MTDAIDLGIDPGSLTIDEQILLEESAGVTLGEMMRFMPLEDGGGGEPMPMRTLAAWVMIAGRRQNPDLTVADVRAMTTEEFGALVEEIQSGNARAGAEPAPGQRTSDGSLRSRTGSASRRRISGV